MPFYIREIVGYRINSNGNRVQQPEPIGYEVVLEATGTVVGSCINLKTAYAIIKCEIELINEKLSGIGSP